MDTIEDGDQAAEPPAKVKSVAATILGEFFGTLEKEEGFGEIAPRLRNVVLKDGVFAEPSITQEGGLHPRGRRLPCIH